MEAPAIYISYVITEIFCIFFSVGIMMRANKNVGTDLQMGHFRGMTVFYMLYLLNDIIWALGQGKLIPFNRLFNQITSSLGLVAVSLLILNWCLFVIYRIDQKQARKMKLLIRLHYCVAAIDCLLAISSVFTGFYFYVDDNDILHTGNGNVLRLALACLQLFGSGIYSFGQSLSNKQVKIRKEYILPLVFIIIPAAAGVLEDLLPLTPIVPLGIFLAIHLAFLEIQNSEIYSDALTGLNNRRRMEMYLQDKIQNASEAKSFCIYMIDVNDFKHINDKFGHIAGDRALQFVADALRNVADRLHGFCARYGGDEFVLIINDATDIQTAVQNEVNALIETNADPIGKITISAGHTVCCSDDMTAPQLIAKADEQLYNQKAIFHGNKTKT